MKTLKKCLSLLLAVCLLMGCVPLRTEAAESVDPTRYSYSVTPLLSPFAYYLYVRTDNPDPTSFRLVDDSSVFYQSGAKGEIRENSSSREVDPGTYYISRNLYEDVVYENEETFRVPGGYIFLASAAFSDGGEFVLLKRTASGSSILHDTFARTAVKIPCPKMETINSYLIGTCTSPSRSFFQNLDAVQTRLAQIAVYPRSIMDVSKPNESRPYPLLAASPYPELIYNEHYNMYNTSDKDMLVSDAYPFILHSLTFPGTLSSVAKELNPGCTVSSGSTHAMIDVTWNGETKSYGGAGRGGNVPLMSDKVQKVFTFRGGSGDLGTSGTLDSYYSLLRSYESVAESDMDFYRDLIAGETYRKTIAEAGGTWIRIGVEGYGYGTSFGFVLPLGGGVDTASQAWVDGRYIGKYERVELNARFEDHPKADIIVRDVHYTDYNGKEHTQAVRYSYDSSRDAWTAPFYYNDDFWCYGNMELPPEMILTREQVDALQVDANTAHLPESGLIYDGTEYPGTPFETKLVTGVSLPSTAEVYVDKSITLTAQVTPSDAFSGQVSWTSSDPSVATVSSGFDIGTASVYGKSQGTAVITATTFDGNYSASCTVTVKRDGKKTFTDVPAGAYYKSAVDWAVERGITSGKSPTSFAPNAGCSRGEAVTFLWRAAGSPQPKNTASRFTDLKSGAYYEKAVLWAVEQGITSGMTETTFVPDRTCTRGQIVTFLYRFAGSPAVSGTNPFTDAQSGYYVDPVLWASREGVTQGKTTTTFEPDAKCTRAQIVTFLYRDMA